MQILARRPFLWMALCLAGGIVFNYAMGGMYGWMRLVLPVGLAAGVLLYGSFRFRAKHVGRFSNCLGAGRYPAAFLMLGMGLISFGVGDFTMAFHQQGLDAEESRLHYEQELEAEFEVLESPEAGLGDDDEGFWKTGVAIYQVDGLDFKNGSPILLYGQSVASELRRGNCYRGKIKIYYNYPRAYPGAFSYEEYLRQNGFCARGKLLGDPQPVAEARGMGRFWQKLEDVRREAVRNTLRLLPDQRGAFLAAAMFGYRQDLSPGTRNEFRYIGTGHILAISGLHVGLVVGLFWFCGMAIFRNRRLVAAICIVACLSYLALCGGRTAAMRAGIIALVYLGGVLAGRKSDFLNSLGVAAFLILVVNPLQFFSLGFQLSFMAVVFISCLGRELAYLLPLRLEIEQQKRGWKQTAKVWLCGLGAMSVCAWLGVLPLSAMAFMQVSFSGLGLNMIAVPLMSLALAGGILLQLAAFLPEWLGMYAADILALPSQALLWLAQHGQVIPGGGVAAFSPPLWLLVGYYVGFGVFLSRRVLTRQIGRVGVKRWITGVTGAGAFLLLVMMLYSCFVPAAELQPQTVVLGGRRGECAISFLPEGWVMATGWLPREGKELRSFLLGMRVRRLDQLRLCESMDEELLRQNLSGLEPCEIVPPQQDSGNRYRFLFANAEGYQVNGDWNGKKKVQWVWIQTEKLQLLLSGWIWPEKEKFLPDLLKLSRPDVLAISFLNLRGRRSIRMVVGEHEQKKLSRYRWGAVKIINGKVFGFDGMNWVDVSMKTMNN